MAFSEEVLWFFSIPHFTAASLRENQDMVQRCAYFMYLSAEMPIKIYGAKRKSIISIIRGGEPEKENQGMEKAHRASDQVYGKAQG